MLKSSKRSNERFQNIEVPTTGPTVHWTAEGAGAFVHSISMSFIAQLEKRMEEIPLSQAALARRLGVSEGAVSKVLNSPENLTVKTMVSYARAIGLKVALVAYDDGDLQNEKGPVDPEILSICWARSGKPRDFWSLPEPQQVSSTSAILTASVSGFASGFPCKISLTRGVQTATNASHVNWTSATLLMAQGTIPISALGERTVKNA